MQLNFYKTPVRLSTIFMRCFFLIGICLTILPASGQTLHASFGLEKTAKRALYGGTLMVENRKKFGVGIAYQASIMNKGSENVKLSDIFYGAAIQAPIAKSEKIDFFATVRVGFVNQNFLVALPGLETRIKTWRYLSTIFSMGYRVGYPSVGLKLSHPVF